MPDKSLSLLIIGYGNMGQAIVGRWQETLNKNTSFTLISRNPRSIDDTNIEILEPGALPKNTPDIILLCVKPDQVETALKPYAHYKDALFITVAAGVDISTYTSLLSTDKIIRIMPNVAAKIGHSMTTGFTHHPLTAGDKSTFQSLMTALGEFSWLDSEDQFHASTALAGSGPAYFFLLSEYLEKTAQKHGFSEQTAATLVHNTFLGAAKLCEHSSHSCKDLRTSVTSPGGTTEAAVTELSKNLEDLVDEAIAAAISRSKYLSKK